MARRRRVVGSLVIGHRNCGVAKNKNSSNNFVS